MFLLSEFTYDLEKSNAQTFDVSDSGSTGAIDTVRLDFTSNHGNPSHTCIYRFRVHGHEPDAVSVMAMRSLWRWSSISLLLEFVCCSDLVSRGLCSYLMYSLIVLVRVFLLWSIPMDFFVYCVQFNQTNGILCTWMEGEMGNDTKGVAFDLYPLVLEAFFSL